MMAAILNSAHVGFRHCHLVFRHLVIFSQIHSRTLSLHSDSDSNFFNLINLMSAALLNSAILDSAILHKINFTHSFSLNLMMAAILNSSMIDSDSAILDSDTLLSSLRFTQKLSHSTLTLTQTNSIWMKLIHSHLSWWWQESWIVLSWIWSSWIQPS